MTSIKGRYARIEIPLDKVENDKELFLTGDYLSIISISGTGTCEVKLDHRHAQAIDLREISGITGIFERVFFTSDGSGGSCVMFIGTGMAITISPDPQKLRNYGIASTQVSTSTASVTSFSSGSFKLRDVSLLNTNAKYPCYIGPYNSNAAVFKAFAYIVLPHKRLGFSMLDMYTIGCISYDGTHNVKIAVIGTYE